MGVVSDSPAENPPTAPEREPVGRYPTARKAHEYGLVALSQGAPYWVEREEDGGYALFVSPVYAERVRRHMDLYRKEQRFWPPVPLTLPDHPTPYSAAVAWAGTLAAFHFVALTVAGWTDAGRLSATEVMGGAWWQVFTALTLHAGGAHLASNAVLGGALYYVLSRATGAGIAALIAVAGGAAGNVLNAWFHAPGEHLSVGASSAVFAVVGALAAMPLGNRAGRRRHTENRAWIAPLLAGAVLLGWFGAGGDGRTDVTAHLFGFAAGLPLGFAVGALARDTPFRRTTQWRSLGLAAALLALAWWAAMR